MEIVKNNKLLDRRNFLHRAIYNHNCENVDAAEAEIAKLDAEIKKNVAEALAISNSEIVSKVDQIKAEVSADGDFKRGIARILIGILENQLSNEEIKGVMRQGYKIMRTRC